MVSRKRVLADAKEVRFAGFPASVHQRFSQDLEGREIVCICNPSCFAFLCVEIDKTKVYSLQPERVPNVAEVAQGRTFVEVAVNGKNK
jgi:hypothetical protein